jgi:enterobactin synthetase component D
MSFEISIKNALPHGVLAGISLPGVSDPVPDDVLARLHPTEREFASGLKGFRQASYVGGRLAARLAQQGLGRNPLPVLSDPRGAPVPPSGISLSISHKNHLAVALAARADLGSLGVDLETLSPSRVGVAPRVLRPEELEAVMALPEERQWTATVVRFSIKEAIYKALAPRLQRYIDFKEASVDPGVDGVAQVTLHLEPGPTPASLEARYTWFEDVVLSSVRVRWT